MKILGICGSLRQASLNRRLLAAAGDMFSDAVEFGIADLAAVPLYNGDHDGEVKPEGVALLLAQIAESDGLLFATPEYNYGIPGVLKNALDWASRPAFQSPLTQRRCGILSASPSPLGGARAQSQLRAVLAGTLSPVYPAVDMLVAQAGDAFDDAGRLVAETPRRRVERYVTGFEAWLAGAG